MLRPSLSGRVYAFGDNMTRMAEPLDDQDLSPDRKKSPTQGMLAALRAEIVARGLHRKPTTRILMELLLHAAVLTLGYAGVMALPGAGLKILAFFVLMLGWLGVSTNSHTSAHGATSDSRRLNAVLTWFGFGVIGGLSVGYWRHKHNNLHHGMPNVDGVDPDHEFTPFFALSVSQRERLAAIPRFFARFQGITFPMATGLLLPNMTYQGLKHAIANPRLAGGWKGLLADAAATVLSLGVWWGLPLVFLTPAEVLLFNAVRLVVYSYILFVVFAPAHLPHEAVFYAHGREPKDFVRRQTETTLNYRAGFFGFFLSGLQYQIEHHLFPGLSHVHYRRLAPIVKRACQERGLPYRELSWGSAIGKCVLVGFRPKETVEA